MKALISRRAELPACPLRHLDGLTCLKTQTSINSQSASSVFTQIRVSFCSFSELVDRGQL